MKFLSFALLTVLSVFSSFVTAQEADASRPISFKMASVKGFSMQGLFKGEYRVLPGSIELKITKSDFFLADNSLYRGSRLLDHLTFGLATLTEGGKKFRTIKTSQSKPLDIKKVMRPLDRHSLGIVYFSIPTDKKTDLSKIWIVATLTVDILEPYEGMTQKTGFSYAHACQNIFTLENAAPCVSRF
jgi:hypothetical protein